MDTSTKYITSSAATGDTTFITGNLNLQKSGITDVGALITGTVPFTLTTWPLQYGPTPLRPNSSDAQIGYTYLNIWPAQASGTTWTQRLSQTFTNHGLYLLTGKARFNYTAGTDATTKAAINIDGNSSTAGTTPTYTDQCGQVIYTNVEYVNSQLNKSINFCFIFPTQLLGLTLYINTASSNGTTPTDGGFISITRIA
jgi:hypothetical protein